MGSAIVGTALESPVRFVVTDNDGNPRSNVAVNFSASGDGRVSAEKVLSDNTGTVETRWTLGTLAGSQDLTAFVPDMPNVRFTATALPDRATYVILGNTSGTMTILGDTLRIAGLTTDRYGNSIATEPVYTVEAGAEAVAASAPGAFVARAKGTARIRVQADTAKAYFTIAVAPGVPVIDLVAPDTIAPGTTLSLLGSNFAYAPELIELTVGGVRVPVTRANESSIEAVIPNNLFPCAPTSVQAVRVSIAGAATQKLAPLRVANRVSLEAGESASLLNVDQARCAELVEPSSPQRAKYVLAVLNTSVTAATYSGFELRASGGGLLAKQAATAQTGPATSMAQSGGALRASTSAAMYQQLIDEEKGHAAFLDRQRRVVADNGSASQAWSRLSSLGSNAARARVAPLVGDTLVMKAIYSSCTVGRDVRARVAYVGAKSVILEDVLSPRAGQLDAQYRAMGAEFDAVQYPLLRASMGDPLAMDAALGGDGRVTMLFTRYVNDSLPGIQGYATACNFYPKSVFAPSNQDEVFYARVATATEDPESWRRAMRSTLLHESKHLASFAERIARGQPFEESWLEESTARIAEELYSRTFAGGGAWRSNSGFTSTVGCEIRQCDDRPLMMWKHFSVLHQFYRGVDTLTPIGAAASGDFTFYASGWSLVRWAVDHYAIDESAWLRDLVRGGQQVGLAGLAARTGHPVDEMLADWALANAVDDQVAFRAQRSTLSFPSWNMPDIMNGLAKSDPTRFADATPLRIRAFSFGSASLPVTKLRAFSSSYFSFEGIQTGSQVFELRGENGGVLPPSLRVAIVRVE